MYGLGTSKDVDFNTPEEAAEVMLGTRTVDCRELRSAQGRVHLLLQSPSQLCFLCRHMFRRETVPLVSELSRAPWSSPQVEEVFNNAIQGLPEEDQQLGPVKSMLPMLQKVLLPARGLPPVAPL